MTLPTPSSPSSAQPSAPDREDPHCPPIVPDSMSVAPESAGVIDDAQWTDIVLSSLSTRSREAREALLKALQNDQPARSVGSSSSMETDWSIGEPEVSRDAAVRNDQTQASSDVSNNINRDLDHGDRNDNAETSPRTVSPILPLGSNARPDASGKDRLNGQCTTDRSIPSSPRANPVGCTNPHKSSENQHLGDALCPKCSPIVSPRSVHEDHGRRSFYFSTGADNEPADPTGELPNGCAN